MMRAVLVDVLYRHNVPIREGLLVELEGVVDQLVEDAWLDNDQALELLPQINGVKSLASYMSKHRVRRRTAVQRTSDVLRAVAKGDRRRRREDDY